MQNKNTTLQWVSGSTNVPRCSVHLTLSEAREGRSVALGCSFLCLIGGGGVDPQGVWERKRLYTFYCFGINFSIAQDICHTGPSGRNSLV